MARETTLWTWLKKARDVFGEALHMRRVENAAGVGDSDVDGLLHGRPFSIEDKVAKRPARENTVLKFGSELTVAQVEYARRRIMAGGGAGFLIQVGSGYDREIYFVHGLLGPTLAAGVTEPWLRATAQTPNTPAEAVLMATKARSPFND